MLTSCSNDDDNNIVTPQAKEYFTLWNPCETLTALQDYEGRDRPLRIEN